MSHYILGIHDGHNCGAALCKDGQIVAAVCEERLTRKKNEVGFPLRAIQDVIQIAGITYGDIDACVFASIFMHAPEHLRDIRSWYAVGSREQQEAESRPAEYDEAILKSRQAARTQQAMKLLGASEDKISFVEHHDAHLAAAYHTSPYGHSPALGITCDGAGDGVSATVSLCIGNEYERIATTDRHASLGKIYSRMTFLMGMMPWQDEYKLMGLAPYANQGMARFFSTPLFELLELDGMKFRKAGDLSTNYCYEYLEDSFRRVRFDVRAGAVQYFTENMLADLVRNAIEITGVGNVVCGGGVFMNVKANGAIAKLSSVKSLYVMPSAADESLAIGACLYKWYEDYPFTPGQTSSFRDLYLGNEFSSDEIEREISTALAHVSGVTVCELECIESEVIDLLHKGKIVARHKGRMEWGARALGNRSILALANDYGVVGVLNKAIKNRDFWMPFAPSMTPIAATRYIEDQKDLRPYYMTYAFDVKENRAHEIAAAIHPHDLTTRPQIVTESGNQDYYEVVKACGGVLLNTSFNLHGYPIVYTPYDAIKVFLDSGLEYLALGNFMLKKGARNK